MQKRRNWSRCPLGMWTRVGLGNHVLEGVQNPDPRTWMEWTYWGREGAGSGHARTRPVVHILKVTQQETELVRCGCRLGVLDGGRTLARPTEYDWTVRVWRQWGPCQMIDHSLLLESQYYVSRRGLLLQTTTESWAAWRSKRTSFSKTDEIICLWGNCHPAMKLLVQQPFQYLSLGQFLEKDARLCWVLYIQPVVCLLRRLRGIMNPVFGSCTRSWKWIGLRELRKCTSSALDCASHI